MKKKKNCTFRIYIVAIQVQDNLSISTILLQWLSFIQGARRQEIIEAPVSLFARPVSESESEIKQSVNCGSESEPNFLNLNERARIFPSHTKQIKALHGYLPSSQCSGQNALDPKCVISSRGITLSITGMIKNERWASVAPFKLLCMITMQSSPSLSRQSCNVS